jgi:uncharacterized protein YbaP (TraB family)
METRRLRNTRRLAACFFVYVAASFYHAAAAAPEAGKRPIWRIQSPTNVVYLLGSIHYLKPQNYPLDPAIEAAFKDAKTVVFEMNLDSTKGDEAQHLLVKKAAYPDKTTLQQHVSETTYQLTADKLNQIGLDIGLFKAFKPWFVANMIIARSMQAMGFDPAYGVDQYFFRKAKEAGKKTVALETFENQLDVLNKMPDFVQDLMLLQTVRTADSMRAGVNTIVKAWSAGDLKTLDATLLQSMREYPEVYQRVIVERNRTWLPKINAYLKENESYLVIVGAGHLAGKEGLVEALKAQGYSVEQL